MAQSHACWPAGHCRACAPRPRRQLSSRVACPLSGTSCAEKTVPLLPLYYTLPNSTTASSTCAIADPGSTADINLLMSMKASVYLCSPSRQPMHGGHAFGSPTTAQPQTVQGTRWIPVPGDAHALAPLAHEVVAAVAGGLPLRLVIIAHLLVVRLPASPPHRLSAKHRFRPIASPPGNCPPARPLAAKWRKVNTAWAA